MPYIENSSYSPTVLFKNGHINTVYRSIFSNHKILYTRERVELKDGDFIDIDTSSVNSKKLVVIIHGLEGNSKSNYVVKLAKLLNNNGYDIMAMNLRGCSGETNRLFISYHCGKTEDIDEIVEYIDTKYSYSEINLVGYSLGGNMVLKYLGEHERQKIDQAVAISVPCDLKATAIALKKLSNKLYLNKFISSIKRKLIEKHRLFPDSFLTKKDILSIQYFEDFDRIYTVPANNFKNVKNYWATMSCKQFIPKIKTNTLLLNALDDPLLSVPISFPIKEAIENSFFHLETPKFGGHVGFITQLDTAKMWSEHRVLSFFKNEQ